jgi:dihydroorotase
VTPAVVTVPRFFDAHVHLRDGDLLRAVAPATARVCSRAVVMPNVPAVETAADAMAYEARITGALAGQEFVPLMTVKLTHRTTPGMVLDASNYGAVAAKVYPEGATTGSHDGVRDFKALGPVLDAMQGFGMVLCVHCEDPDQFVLDRETAYLKNVIWALKEFPRLKIVVEHVTTWQAVNFVSRGPDRLGATITAHHLRLTLDDVIGRGIRPHYFCYPVPKYEADREHLLRAAQGAYGDRIFLGSDSAPHRRQDKEASCGCAGVYSAPVLAETLAETFLPEGFDDRAVGRLTDFTSRNGEKFYGLAPQPGTIDLCEWPYLVPGEMPGGVVPYRAREVLRWSVRDRGE